MDSGTAFGGLGGVLAQRPAVNQTMRRMLARLDRAAAVEEKTEEVVPERESRAAFGPWAARRLNIKTKDGRVVPFRVNRIQRHYLLRKRQAIREGKRPRYLLLKYRRGGFTTVEQGISYHRSATRRYQAVMTLAHTEKATKGIFEIATRYWELDPYAPMRKNSNSTILDFNALGSKFFFGTAGGDSPGRGDTLQRFHGSEVAWWFKGDKKIEKQLEIMSGLSEATSHGEVVLETTPNGREWFHNAYTDAKKGLNDYTPIFFPWFMDEGNIVDLSREACDEIYDTITESEKGLLRKAREQFGIELGCQHIAWRRQRMADPAVGPLFPQEYPEDDESCWLAAGTPWFDQDELLAILDAAGDYNRKHVPGGYEAQWDIPRHGRDYIIGVDTSEGVRGGDPNGCGVLMRDPLQQVATVHGHFRPRALAEHAARLSEKYNNALIAVERENHGHAVLEALENLGIRGKARVWEYTKGRAGWSTNAETRPRMLEALRVAVSEQAEGKLDWIRDREFIGECRSFGLQANGKWEHPPGGHDDTLFKWGIALCVHQMGGKRTAGGFIARPKGGR